MYRHALGRRGAQEHPRSGAVQLRPQAGRHRLIDRRPRERVHELQRLSWDQKIDPGKQVAHLGRFPAVELGQASSHIQGTAIAQHRDRSRQPHGALRQAVES